MSETKITIKPFLKWAGGKSQILQELDMRFPADLKTGTIKNYCEPFLGGGAVFFHIAQNYPIENSILVDVNVELILVYQVIKNDPDCLIEILENYKKEYEALDEIKRKEFFYEIRETYNQTKPTTNCEKYSKKWILRAAQMIFLNKTCFNGLFRLNSKGEFNVPFGKYKNPKFYEIDNIYSISKVLQKAELICADFSCIEDVVTSDYFVYFDPPYRPISKTSSFTSYAKNEFKEEDQIRLSILFRDLDKKGAKLMLSNSDPKNVNIDDNFFEIHYKEFKIERVLANRMINCNGNKRGKINEIIITNY